jgi:hypothetical protein
MTFRFCTVDLSSPSNPTLCEVPVASTASTSSANINQPEIASPGAEPAPKLLLIRNFKQNSDDDINPENSVSVSPHHRGLRQSWGVVSSSLRGIEGGPWFQCRMQGNLNLIEVMGD